MQVTDLKDWDKLTPKEQARIKKVYGEVLKITKTLHDTKTKKEIDNG